MKVTAFGCFGTATLLWIASSSIGLSETSSSVQGYNAKCEELERRRLIWNAEFREGVEGEQKRIVEEARDELLRFFSEDCFPAWYGTKWDFSGTTATPGEGRIACGYFVSTTLKHAGFRLNRYRIAQQASQKIIEVFSDREKRKIMVGKPVSEVVSCLKQCGPGLYIVGLDSHVGFLLYREGKMQFVHSSYYRPDAFVKSESLEGRNPLADSNYRVVGKILGDRMIEKWLVGEEFSLGD